MEIPSKHAHASGALLAGIYLCVRSGVEMAVFVILTPGGGEGSGDNLLLLLDLAARLEIKYLDNAAWLT